jgi:hypothetical protein
LYLLRHQRLAELTSVFGHPGGRRASRHPWPGTGSRQLAHRFAERFERERLVRADCEPEDLPILTLMLSAVIDAGHQLAPDLWRRYLAIVLQGLRAKPAPPEPLPTPPVPPGKLDKVLLDAWKPRRG